MLARSAGTLQSKGVRNIRKFRHLRAVRGETSWRDDAADLRIWLSLADPAQTRSAIERYVNALDDERARDIMRSPQLWASIYRGALPAQSCEDVNALRPALAALFAANVRALEALPARERRRFLERCHEGERDILLDGGTAAPIAPSLRLRRAAPAALALAFVVAAIGVTLHQASLIETGERLPFVPAVPTAHVATQSARLPQRIHASHVDVAVVRNALRAIVGAAARPALRAPRPARISTHRAFPRAHRRLAFAPVALPAPATAPAAPSPQTAIAGLYQESNPDAAILSVVIVQNTPETVVADVTTRQDAATIVDRLILAPRGDALQLVAVQRLTQDPQSSRACFLRGVWKPCVF